MKMEKSFEQKISSTATVARMFALISIVCAHVTFTQGTPYLIVKLYQALASIGVVCYLFVSGYYYNPKKYSFIELIKNKGKTIGLPWLFLGTVSYLYKAILSKSFGAVDYLKYMIGNGSFLYFMTVLVICFLIFYKTNKAILFCAIGVNFISLALTATGIINPIIDALHITNYLNVFNWAGIFALGMLVKKIPAEKIYIFLKRTRLIFLALFVLAIAFVLVFDMRVGYFSYFGIWLELLGMLAIFGVSTIDFFAKSFVFDISNMSFTIYLVHMMVIGVFDSLYNIHPVTQAVSVFIIIGVCYCVLSIAKWVLKLAKLEKYLFPLFGFRTR